MKTKVIWLEVWGERAPRHNTKVSFMRDTGRLRMYRNISPYSRSRLNQVMNDRNITRLSNIHLWRTGRLFVTFENAQTAP